MKKWWIFIIVAVIVTIAGYKIADLTTQRDAYKEVAEKKLAEHNNLVKAEGKIYELTLENSKLRKELDTYQKRPTPSPHCPNFDCPVCYPEKAGAISNIADTASGDNGSTSSNNHETDIANGNIHYYSATSDTDTIKPANPVIRMTPRPIAPSTPNASQDGTDK